MVRDAKGRYVNEEREAERYRVSEILTSAESSRVSLDFLQRNGAIEDTEGRTMLILIDQLRTTGQRFS